MGKSKDNGMSATGKKARVLSIVVCLIMAFSPLLALSVYSDKIYQSFSVDSDTNGGYGVAELSKGLSKVSTGEYTSREIIENSSYGHEFSYVYHDKDYGPYHTNYSVDDTQPMVTADEGVVHTVFSGEETNVIIQFNDSPLGRYIVDLKKSGNTNIEYSLIRSHHEEILSTHQSLKNDLQKKGIEINIKREYTYVFNGIAATVSPKEIEKIRSLPYVRSVYPDQEVKICLDESVPLINADDVWEMQNSTGAYVTGKDIVVAIIDTGIDYMHPDLGSGFGSGYKVIGGYDFVNNDNDPMDDNGHGTHCAGIVTANGTLKGVAPDAKLMAYKVLDSGGHGTESDIITGIERACDPDQNPSTDDAVDIISLSLGGYGNPDDSASQAVDNAFDLGVVVVVAAGNSGPTYQTIDSPGCARKALTTGVTDKNDTLADWSSRGLVIWNNETLIKPDVLAPGVNIKSTWLNGGYRSESGSSMSAPHVAGTAALLLQLHKNWTTTQVKASIMNTAVDLNYPLCDQGAGRIDALRSAITQLLVTNSSISFGLVVVDKNVILTAKNTCISSISVNISVYTILGMYLNRSIVEIPQSYNYIQVNVTTISIEPNTNSTVRVSVTLPLDAPDGYYWGKIIFQTNPNYNHTVVFSFGVWSTLKVHVLDEEDNEMVSECLSSDKNFIYFRIYVISSDPLDNGIYSFDTDADPGVFPSPITVNVVPAGTLNVHVLGFSAYIRSYHFDTVHYAFILSDNITVGKMETRHVYLCLGNAHNITLKTESFSGTPFFSYGVSFQVVYKHRPIRLENGLIGRTMYAGNEIFNQPTNFTYYISDINEAVVIRQTGYAYSPMYWDFIKSNKWNYALTSQFNDYLNNTYPLGSPLLWTSATADEEYLFCFLLENVNDSTPSILNYSIDDVSAYNITYNHPGTIPQSSWPDLIYGSMSQFGASVANFYLPTSGNYFGMATSDPVYHGLRRTVYVKGCWANVWSQLYWDRYPSRFESFRNDFFETNWEYDSWETGIVDPDFLVPLPAEKKSVSVCTAPFHPKVIFNNTNGEIRLYYPILSDRDGTIATGREPPYIEIYQGTDANPIFAGSMNGFWWTPPRLLVVNTTQPGNYTVIINQDTGFQVSNQILIKAGFSVPSIDMDPPVISGLDMPQGFTSEETLLVSLTVGDYSGISNVGMWYGVNNDTPILPLSVTQINETTYIAQIPTDSLTESISLRVNVTDIYNNFIDYTTMPASIRKTPIHLNLNLSTTTIPFIPNPYIIHINGTLKDLNDKPLSPTTAALIKVLVNNMFVGYITDLTYNSNSSSYTTGAINFNWTFVPTNYINDTAENMEVEFNFTLGTYTSTSNLFLLNINRPPKINSVAPVIGPIITEEQCQTFTLNVSDPNNDMLTISWYLNNKLVGDAPSYTFIANYTSAGSYEVKVVVSDGSLYANHTWMLTVTNVNRAPVLTNPLFDKSFDEDYSIRAFNLNGYFSDPDGEKLDYTVSGNNHIIVVINPDGAVNLSASENWYGNEMITFRATDPYSAFIEDTIIVTVNPINDAPVIVGMLPSFDKNEDNPIWVLDLTNNKSDVDNTMSELVWSVSNWNTPLFSSVTVVDNNITFDLKANAYGNNEITITLSDGLLTDSQNIWINVTPINDPPVIAGLNDQPIVEDVPFWYDITSYISDVDNDISDLVVSTNSSYIIVHNNNHTLEMNYPNGVTVDYVKITISDGINTSHQDIMVIVTPVNDAPVINSFTPISNPIIDEGEEQVFTVSASDVDNTDLTITWYLNDNPMAVSNTYTFISYYNSGGTYIVKVVVSDGSLTNEKTWILTVKDIKKEEPKGLLPGFEIICVVVAIGIIAAAITSVFVARRKNP